MTPEMVKKGRPPSTTDSKELKRAVDYNLHHLSKAIKKHVDEKENQLEHYYPKKRGFPYKLAENKKLGIRTDSNEKLRQIQDLALEEDLRSGE